MDDEGLQCDVFFVRFRTKFAWSFANFTWGLVSFRQFLYVYLMVKRAARDLKPFPPLSLIDGIYPF